jgi:OFA family oxalate/formate antiporter-like MFS transporter
MREESTDPTPSGVNQGWQVTFAGFGINLALGILYTWSVISSGIPEPWGWSQADKSWPYAVACLVFCLVMVPAGRLQDKLSPRRIATIGGILVGLGMIWASYTTTPTGYVLGFGVLAGAGIGFGYASATPPAVKWFSANRTGLIAGIVVSGFGLASVYAAPLSKWLIDSFGLAMAVRMLGIAFLIVVAGLAQFLKTPPPGYVPEGAPPPSETGGPQKKEEYLPREMLGTWQFYLLWFMYACGAGAGLMIISKLTKIVSAQVGLTLGFGFVAVLAVGNGAGRIIAGMLSDKIGRKRTMFLCFALQAALIVVLSQITTGSPLANMGVLALIAALIGANYGANLALFPSITKDYYGLQNFGMNYGLVFTAWGVGGFMLALLAGKVYDATGNFNFAYYCSASLLILAAMVTFIVKPPQQREESPG